MLLALSLVTASLVPAQAAAAGQTVRVTSTSVFVRALPNANSALLGTALTGAAFTLTSGAVNNGFYQINYHGRTGYISTRYVALQGSAATVGQPAAGMVTVTTTSLNVRSQPNANSTAIGTVYYGAQYALLNYTPINGFYEISFNGRTGYVSTRYTTTGAQGNLSGGTAAAPAHPTGSTLQVITTSVNVRSQPSAYSVAVGTAFYGNTFHLLSPTPINGFYSISYKGGAGYISASYAQVVSGAGSSGAMICCVAAAAAPQYPVYTTNYPVYTTTTTTTQPVSYNAVQVNQKSVFVRSQPSTTSSIVGTAHLGDIYTVTSTQSSNGYIQINFFGITGYISSNYVTFVTNSGVPTTTKRATTTPPPVAYYTAVQVTATSVYVREQANANANIIGSARLGDMFVITGSQNINGYIQIDYHGRTGFISAGYVTLVAAGSTTRPSTTRPTTTRYTTTTTRTNPPPTATGRNVVVVGDYVQIRAQATTNSEVLGVAARGLTFPLLQSTAVNGFYAVLYKGRTAYVAVSLTAVI
jgi:N-acetylmuramoyl-L-alanine amidase